MSGVVPSSRRARIGVATALAVAIAAAGVGTVALADIGGASASGAATTTASRTGTAPVQRGDLTDVRRFAGTLGYGDPEPVAGAAGGTITSLPSVGEVIRRDGQLYAVDEHPVRSMHGTVPLYRTLARGLRGQDVKQLNDNLRALGYDVATDDAFGARTERAVRQYRRDRGLPAGATLGASEIGIVPGDVRVAEVTARPGSPGTGALYTVTGTKRVVTVTVPARDGSRLEVGGKVEVRVDGAEDPFPGVVTGVAPGTSDDGAATVVATARIDADLPASLTNAVGAQVDAAGRTVTDVLSVPVTALRAGRGDGYAVDVVGGPGRSGGSGRPGGSGAGSGAGDRAADGRRRVAVEVGLVAGDRVEVRGELREGDRVEVPA